MLVIGLAPQIGPPDIRAILIGALGAIILSDSLLFGLAWAVTPLATTAANQDGEREDLESASTGDGVLQLPQDLSHWGDVAIATTLQAMLAPVHLLTDGVMVAWRFVTYHNRRTAPCHNRSTVPCHHHQQPRPESSGLSINPPPYMEGGCATPPAPTSTPADDDYNAQEAP